MPSLPRSHTPTILGLLLFLVLAAGCGAHKPELQHFAPLPAGAVCRIAVLPMVNQSGYKLGDTVFYRVFMAELQRAGNYQLAQEGDVRNIYRQLKIIPGQLPDASQTRILAGQLEAQLVIVGTVIEMAEKPLERGVNPQLAVSLRCLDASTGRTLMTTYHRRSGDQYRKVMHFGVVNTITALSSLVAQEILEQWFAAGGMQRCAG